MAVFRFSKDQRVARSSRAGGLFFVSGESFPVACIWLNIKGIVLGGAILPVILTNSVVQQKGCLTALTASQ